MPATTSSCRDFCMEVNWLAERSNSLSRSHAASRAAGERGDGMAASAGGQGAHTGRVCSVASTGSTHPGEE